MSDVLFVCVANAGRSQMAKAIFNRMAKERGLQIKAESAGTNPAEHVHHSVAQVMEELELDLSQSRPKAITDEMVRGAQRVITMGCAIEADTCPSVRLKETEDWALPDPASKRMEEVRAIHDMVAQKVERLIDTL